ncbi:exonuclease [Serratia phage 92A1]|nr:exonuclease [Serratia phage 92A1]
MRDFIADFETFNSVANSTVIDLALIAFDPDPTVYESFAELIARGKRIKFDLASQKGKRSVSTGTIAWWKSQSAEAKKNLVKSAEDVTTLEGTRQALDYLREQGVDPWKSEGWCRGMSFDFPIFTDLIRELYKHDTGCEDKDIDTFKLEPVKFWQQRDIRTAISCYSLVRGLSTTPLPKGALDGFVAHDSVHDCAKDVLMLKYAQRYALGLEECPDEANADPLSLPKTR